MLGERWDGRSIWAFYCDKCEAYISDFTGSDDEVEDVEDEVICQDCLDREEDEGEDEDEDEELYVIDDWRQKVAHALEEDFGPCPFGRTALLKWIGNEVGSLKARGVPRGEAATTELWLSYEQWIGDDSPSGHFY
jgi:hypothetical protein